jgi:hypothetical protein
MDSSNRANNYESTWTRRFIGAAIIQGAIIVGLTVFLILNQISILKPEVSRVIAVGGAEIWLTLGDVMYVVVGVVGMAVSALFYYHLEKVMGKYYSKHHSEDNGLDPPFAYEHWNHCCNGLVDVCWVFRRSCNASKNRLVVVDLMLSKRMRF